MLVSTMAMYSAALSLWVIILQRIRTCAGNSNCVEYGDRQILATGALFSINASLSLLTLFFREYC
jgi:hypothetical protein